MSAVVSSAGGVEALCLSVAEGAQERGARCAHALGREVEALGPEAVEACLQLALGVGRGDHAVAFYRS